MQPKRGANRRHDQEAERWLRSDTMLPPANGSKTAGSFVNLQSRNVRQHLEFTHWRNFYHSARTILRTVLSPYLTLMSTHQASHVSVRKMFRNNEHVSMAADMVRLSAQATSELAATDGTRGRVSLESSHLR